MSVKLTEWRLKMTENAASILSKLNSAADKTSNKMGSVQGKFTNFTNEIPQAGRVMDLLGSRAALGGAAVAAAGAVMYKSGQLALTYEEAMAKVNATAQLTPEKLAELKEQLVAIGEDSAGNFMRIPDAFEKINSQVNNVGKSLEILKVANKGAQAGFVDIDLAAGALAQTLSIVGNRDNASGIMDTLLKAKAVGAGEFQDFATYLPQLIASGDNMNINHKDVAGLFAFMTAKGQSSSDSAMLLQNAFTAMGKSQVQEGFAKQGMKLFDKDGNMRDLGIFFGELQRKLGKMNAESKSNWLEAVGLKDSQAKNAFSVLAGDADKLKEIMNDVRNSTGELNAQLEKTQNHTRSWAQIGDQIKSGMVGLGDYLLPIVDKILQGAVAWKNAFTGNHAANFGEVKVRDMQKGQAEAQGLAERVMKEKYPWMGPGMFENKGAKMEPKQKNEYQDIFNYELAKRTGAFGGDYDKFVADEKAKLMPKTAEPKVTFHNDKKKKLKEGIDNINEGGKAPRIINVNFGKLNENIIIQPQSLKEGTAQVVTDMEAMLVRIIEGTEVSVANE